jgi:hypothetical protein
MKRQVENVKEKDEETKRKRKNDVTGEGGKYPFREGGE